MKLNLDIILDESGCITQQRPQKMQGIDGFPQPFFLKSIVKMIKNNV